MNASEFNKYIKSSEFKAILARYEEIASTDGLMYMDPDDIVDIAEYYHINNDLEKAEKAADYCLRIAPNNAAALLFKARMALVDYFDVPEAKELMKRVNVDDEYLEAVYVTAEIMLQEEGPEKADAYLEEKYLIYKDKADYDYDDDDPDDQESDPDFALEVAMMYCDNGYFDYAERWMKKTTLPNDSTATDYLDTWARIFIAQMEWTKAVNILNELLDHDAFNVRAWLMMSDAQFHLAQYQDALASAEYAQAIDNNDPEAMLTRGNCLYALCRFEEAKRCFEQYLRLSPDDSIGQLLLASTLSSLDKDEEAFQMAEKLIDNIGDMPLIHATDALRACASIGLKNNDTDFAFYCCDRLEELGVDPEEVDLTRATICIETDNIGDAMTCFTRAVERSNYSLKTIAAIGIVCYETGLLNMGYRMLKEAVMPYEADDLRDCPARPLAFLTAASREMKLENEYLYYLKHAIRKAPLEIAALLGENFPPGTEVRRYYEIEKERYDSKKQ